MSTPTPRSVRVSAGGEWRWIGVGVVAVVLALLLGEAARSSDGAARALLVLGQAVATGLAFVVPQLRQWRASRAESSAEEREIEARIETRIAINDALDPVLRLLGRIAVGPDPVVRAQLAAQAVTLVLATAAEFIGPARSRACWFVLEPGPPATLVPTEHAGRAGPPATQFIAGTVSGDAAIELSLTDGAVRYEDITSAPPPGWAIDHHPSYRTFLAVAVTGQETGFGMLTLDALSPGSLTADDEGLLRLMAGLLALALELRAAR